MCWLSWSEVQVTVHSRSVLGVQESVSTSVHPKPLYSLALLLPLTPKSSSRKQWLVPVSISEYQQRYVSSQVQVTVHSRSRFQVQESVSTSVNPKPLYSLALLLPLTQSFQVGIGDWCRLAFLGTKIVVLCFRCKSRYDSRSDVSL